MDFFENIDLTFNIGGNKIFKNPFKKMGKDKAKDPQNGSVEALDKADEEEERGNWGNQCEFFLSCLGYAVGFGNIWRFPFLCYKNGGAVFLIPYSIMLLCAGLPLFFMELVIGQYASLGPNIVFGTISPIFKGIGWGMIAVSALTAMYYNIILAWTLFYTFASFTSELPWSTCDNSFNSPNCFTSDDSINCRNQSMFYYKEECHSITDFCQFGGYTGYNSSHCVDPANATNILKAAASVDRISASEDYFKNRMLRVKGTDWDAMGEMNWELVGCLALAWVIVGLCLIKGVKSSGKVVYFTALFPYVVLVILFVRGVTLDGAYKGIEFYIMKPKWEKLLEVSVWNDAAQQIFYSLGSAFGGLITLSSYNKFKNNCMRDAIVIAFSNCSTSVFAGFVVFSILGFMAKELGLEIEDVVSSGSGLAFVAYPAAVARMPFPPIWSLLFFTMLITLGLDSQFTMVETLTTAVFDQWKPLRERKAIVVISTCVILFLCGLTMCLEGGVYMFELFGFYSAGLSLIFLAIAETVVVQYVYGFRRFMKHITDEMGIWVPAPLYFYWTATWLFITPVSLLVILGFSFYFLEPAAWGDYTFPANIQALGWIICASSIILIPAFAIYIITRGDRVGKELIRSTPEFCPEHIRKMREKNQAATKGQPEGTFRYIYDNSGYQEGVTKVYPNGRKGEIPPPYDPTRGYNGHSNYM